MSSTSETGHSVNVSNFKMLIDKCASFGAAYNPSNADITIAALTAKWQSAAAADAELNKVVQLSKAPINQRQELYEPVAKLVTRVLNTLKSTKASKLLVQDAKGLADRYRNSGKKPARGKTGSDAAATDGGDTAGAGNTAAADAKDAVKSISTSHQGFVQRANSFAQLVELLAAEPHYAPNEPDLKIASLKALSGSMQQLNNDIGTTIAPLEIKRVARNKELYAPETGLVDLAATCKAYVKAVFGVSAAETRMVSKIRFTRRD